MNICFSFIFVILTLVCIAACAHLEEREISEKKFLLLNMDGNPLSFIGKPYSFSWFIISKDEEGSTNVDKPPDRGYIITKRNG